MTAYIFDKLLADGIRRGQIPARTDGARKWFRDKARQTKVTDTHIMTGDRDRLRKAFSIGRMYAFFYDPKHKKTLPFYDRFPLIFPVERAPGGFFGINMHYLHPRMRATLMDALYTVTSNKKYDETTRLRISMSLLQNASKYRFFKPTLKHYLTRHVRSRFLIVEAAEWDIALFLPTERFEKASKSKVWKDSRSQV